jgi:uncharacterized metal-binding protein
MELKCSICRGQVCREEPGTKSPPAYCPAAGESAPLSEVRQACLADPEVRRWALAAAQVEATGYCRWPRVREVMEFAHRIGATRLGIATPRSTARLFF